MIIPGQFGFNCPSGFREEAFFLLPGERYRLLRASGVDLILNQNVLLIFARISVMIKQIVAKSLSHRQYIILLVMLDKRQDEIFIQIVYT